MVKGLDIADLETIRSLAVKFMKDYRVNGVEAVQRAKSAILELRRFRVVQ